MATFSVDTHLFRELGELLVGRDSTALIELIKNAYDADATRVVVYGESLSSTTRGYIRIQDNGIGMSRSEFENGFLRIASRAKESAERRSAVYERRYTGAKGIGRLAAHKLARVLEITTARYAGSKASSGKDAAGFRSAGSNVEATIDWDAVESKQTLADVAIDIKTISSPSSSAGTTITLHKLRKTWTPTEHGRFLEELQAFQPPPTFISPLPASVSPRLLFDVPRTRDIRIGRGTEFIVSLEGELAPPDDYWIAIAEAANWIIEIDASKRNGEIRYCISPTRSTMDDLPNAAVREFSMPHPSPKSGPFFQARILKRTGNMRGSDDLKQWAGRSSGVRVYLEGFRILPYGETRDDWLQLDKDAAGRPRWSDPEAELAGQLRRAERDPDAGLNHLPNKHYFGAAFLTERDASALRMLVNREGFVPNEAFANLTDIVRAGVDLSTRVQAAATTKQRADRALERSGSRSSAESESTLPMASAIQAAVSEARNHAAKARQFVADNKIVAAGREFELALSKVEAVAETSDEAAEEAAMIRVLASVGTQVASFVHEINALKDMATAIDRALDQLSKKQGLPKEHRRSLASIQKDIGDLRRIIERQASYLIDVVTPDARRRRARQNLATRFETAVRLIERAASVRDIKIINKIPEDLRSPPMFPAEVTTVFSNLLSNAVKAAGSKGTIRASGRHRADETILRVENTGVSVKLRDRERWFRPFESTTANVDTSLGQGMGLGLPITRSMLEEYGATISFVEPSGGFATAIEIVFPD